MTGRCGRCSGARPTGWWVGGPDAFLVIDDTALPKKGTLSAGVARQYCGQLGKRANCQSLVSLTLARGEVPVPVGLRLFLPDEWVGDTGRCARAGVPSDVVTAGTKGGIALAELDRVGAAGVRFSTVLADAGYGASAAFRHGLDARGLAWAVGIPRNQKVYGADVRLVAPGGRARKSVPDQEPRAAEAVLAACPWRRMTWRQGTKGDLVARFAALCIRVTDGAAWGNNRHLPGAEAWLVGEWRAGGECQVLPCQPAAPHVAARVGGGDQGALGVRAGAPAAQGRARAGASRGSVLAWAAPARADDVPRSPICSTCASPDHAGRGRGKMNRRHRPGPPPQPSLPAIRRAIIGRLFAFQLPDVRCPHCQNGSGCRLISSCPGGAKHLVPQVRLKSPSAHQTSLKRQMKPVQ